MAVFFYFQPAIKVVFRKQTFRNFQKRQSANFLRTWVATNVPELAGRFDSQWNFEEHPNNFDCLMPSRQNPPQAANNEISIFDFGADWAE